MHYVAVLKQIFSFNKLGMSEKSTSEGYIILVSWGLVWESAEAL